MDTRSIAVVLVGIIIGAVIGAGLTYFLLPSGEDVIPEIEPVPHPSDREHILVGIPNPTTGPIEAFGFGTPWTENWIVDYINEELGGIYIEEFGKKIPIKIKVYDTESDPAKAAEMATKLILEDKIDIMYARHTPDTVNPVLAIAEKYKCPVVSMEAPIEPVLSGGPYEWSYHSFWGSPDIFRVFVNLWEPWKNETSMVVGGIWPADPDGLAWSAYYPPRLEYLGYTVIDPGRFAYDIPSFHDIIEQFKAANVEIVTGVVPPPIFIKFLLEASALDFKPKIITVAKALLYPGPINELPGSLAEGLSTEVWSSPWHPFECSLTGITCQEFYDTFEAEMGSQWTMNLAFKWAGFEIIYDVLSRAQTLDKTAIRDAIGKTSLHTLIGQIDYGPDHICRLPLVGGQWLPGTEWQWELQIVHNVGHPEIPTTADMTFPVPG